MGNAAVMHVTGGSWTIGTGNYDGINYGLFYSDRMMERIVKNVVAEVRRLKGKKILVGECGHATRSAWFVPTFCGPGRAGGGQLPAVRLRAAASGQDPAEGGEDQGAGDLPRPVQHRPQRADHRGAAGDPEERSARTSWR